MAGYVEGPGRSFPSTAALAKYARVKRSAGVLALAGATEVELGHLQQQTFATTDSINALVNLRNSQGTQKGIADGAIAQDATVYRAANGKISATNNGHPLGTALDAATADGDIIEYLPGASGLGYRLARGQSATVTASDTIVTGLNTLVSVVASFDDNIGDNPEWVTASIGDQAGTPAAGSFLLKTWQNTSGSDPTPVAASTFNKKVNWIAVGT